MKIGENMDKINEHNNRSKDIKEYDEVKNIDKDEKVGWDLNIPTPNFEMYSGGSGDLDMSVRFKVKRTIKMRLKWWLFSLFFPFKYRWLDVDETDRIVTLPDEEDTDREFIIRQYTKR